MLRRLTKISPALGWRKKLQSVNNGLSRSRCNICLYPYLISPATQQKSRGSLSRFDFNVQDIHRTSATLGTHKPHPWPTSSTPKAICISGNWFMRKRSPRDPPIQMHRCKQQRLGCWLSDPNLGVNDLLGIPGCFVPHPLQMIKWFTPACFSASKWPQIGSEQSRNEASTIGDPMLPASPQNEYGSPWQPSVHTKI